MKEVWKNIDGYEDLYMVSNLGRIMSCERYAWNRFSYVKKEAHILIPRYDKKGYTSVALYKNGKRRDFKIHRLVLSSFVPNIDQKEQINHINGIKDDNRLENLEWATQSENQLHAYKNGFCEDKIKIFINRFSKPIAMCDLNDKVLKMFFSAAEANRYFGIEHSHIHEVCNGKRNIALGYKWKYISLNDYHKLRNHYYHDYKIRKVYSKIDVFDLNGKYIRTFSSAQETSLILNIEKRKIYKVCSGELKKANGYIFKYHNK